MGTLRYGVHRTLEDAATELIRASLVGVTRYEDKRDVLTAWKTRNRYRREIYVSSGAPDPALRRGNFHRSASTSHPHLNSTLGVARPGRRGSSLIGFVEEQHAQREIDDASRG